MLTRIHIAAGVCAMILLALAAFAFGAGLAALMVALVAALGLGAIAFSLFKREARRRNRAT